MQFGLFHTVQWPEGSNQIEAYEEAISEIVRADELGFHAVWLTEHHFSRHGIISDSLSVLSHLAGRTSRIRLGTAVTVLPFHNPIRAAESAATVDLLSKGRLEFGTGRGYQWKEFNGFGIDIGERAERFNESMEVILRAWTSSEPFSHKGKYWEFDSVNIQPKPVQLPHPPVWVATDNEEGFRHCIRSDFGVMLRQGTSLEALSSQVNEYRRILTEENRSFDPTKLVIARGLHVAETDDEAWSIAGQHYLSFVEGARAAAASPQGAPQRASNPFTTDSLADTVIFGSPSSCLSQLQTIRELGIEYVLFFVRFGSLPHEAIVRSMELFASEVSPFLQNSISVNE